MYCVNEYNKCHKYTYSYFKRERHLLRLRRMRLFSEGLSLDWEDTPMIAILSFRTGEILCLNLLENSVEHCCCSVMQLCLIVCDTEDFNTPGFPVLH